MSVLANTTPDTRDSIGITLMKILQKLNEGGSSSLLVSTTPTSSSDPGVAGNYAVGPSTLYFHDGTQWYAVSGSTF